MVAGKGTTACNQVLYHSQQRAVEHRIIPWCEQHNVAVVAYSPFGHNDFPVPRAPGGRVLRQIAAAHQATPPQVALAVLTQRRSVFAIAKASAQAHAADNAAAGTLILSPDDIAGIDPAFPRGREPASLRARKPADALASDVEPGALPRCTANSGAVFRIPVQVTRISESRYRDLSSPRDHRLVDRHSIRLP